MITLCSHFNQAFLFFHIFFFVPVSGCARASASPRAALKRRRVETCSTNPATRWSVAQSAFLLCPAIYLPLSPLRGEESQGKGCYSNFNLPPDAAAQRCTHTHTHAVCEWWKHQLRFYTKTWVYPKKLCFYYNLKNVTYSLSVCADRDKILLYTSTSTDIELPPLNLPERKIMIMMIWILIGSPVDL